ncbi:MAG: hypothetical protein R3181_06245 [Rubricoccaceae bacterium]|nr:hypothetical protein [Rubricoccaceae bacterium]
MRRLRRYQVGREIGPGVVVGFHDGDEDPEVDLVREVEALGPVHPMQHLGDRAGGEPGAHRVEGQLADLLELGHPGAMRRVGGDHGAERRVVEHQLYVDGVDGLVPELVREPEPDLLLLAATQLPRPRRVGLVPRDGGAVSPGGLHGHLRRVERGEPVHEGSDLGLPGWREHVVRFEVEHVHPGVAHVVAAEQQDRDTVVVGAAVGGRDAAPDELQGRLGFGCLDGEASQDDQEGERDRAHRGEG